MIGYYVHHEGRGHLHRMHSVAAHLDDEVTVLSSLEPGDLDPPWTGPWVGLPRDDDGPVVAPTANGTLHWAPLHHPGLLARHRRIVEWLDRSRPAALVVDVSVEVAALARLCGVPVVVMAMPGRRTDPPHALAYDQAEALVAPWPEGLDRGWGAPWPERWLAKTTFTGAISRFDADASGLAPDRDPRTVLALWGTGGAPASRLLDDAREATPRWRWWTATGRSRTGPEVWRLLRTAEVVVTHAGQNAVAETAAARAPAVVIADERPFSEQHHTAQRLRRLGIGQALEAWPEPEQWEGVLQAAVAAGGGSWSRWSDGRGAGRAAAAISAAALRAGTSTPCA